MDTEGDTCGRSRFAAGLEDWENQEDFVVPMRTRGAFPKRDVAHLMPYLAGLGPMLGEPQAKPGTGEASTPTHQEPLQPLVSQLREETGHLPLTVVVHGWRTRPAEDFLLTLRPLLAEEDALWLVPGDRASLETTWGVVLDPGRDTDIRLYDNLASDIVFFPAEVAGEADEAKAWDRRARAIVVPDGAPAAADIEKGIERAAVFRWRARRMV